MKQTHYEILQIKASATLEEVRAAYRAMVLVHHPDRSADPKATDKFLLIQQAYEVLSDADRRASYDRLLEMESAPPVTKARPKPKAAPPKPVDEPLWAPTTASKGPISVGAEHMRLTGLLAQARYAEAERLAERLRHQDPRHPIPYAVLGDLYRFRGQLRKAAELYAYAAQMDPTNPKYQQKHEQVLKAVGKPYDVAVSGSQQFRMGPFVVGSALIASAAAYVCMAKEPPAFQSFSIFSTWTTGLIVMLILASVTLGVACAMSGALERFSINSGGVASWNPSALLGLIAIFNFWFAALLYLFVGASQNAFNRSTSVMVMGVGAVVMLFSVCSIMNGGIEPSQTLLWGGNLAYASALLGWFVSDGLRE